MGVGQDDLYMSVVFLILGIQLSLHIPLHVISFLTWDTEDL